MPREQKETIGALMDGFGRTFADEAGINPGRNTPTELFKLLVFSMLSAKRISHKAAISAARALFARGWTSAESMAAATWEDRTYVLNRSGYARYDESTSRYLGETAAMLRDKYGGDLRKLRDSAGRDPKRERALLQEFKGVGDVAVDIFFREAQTAWDELWPYLDPLAAKSARRLGLPADADKLLKLTRPADFPRLLAALVRVQLEKAFDQIRHGQPVEAGR